MFSFKKMHLKLPSCNWRPFCFGLNMLKVRNIPSNMHTVRSLSWSGTGFLQKYFTGTGAILNYRCQWSSLRKYGDMHHTNSPETQNKSQQKTCHHNDLTWAWWRMKSPVTRLFIEQHILVDNTARIYHSFMKGIHRRSVMIDSPHKGSVILKAFLFHDAVMCTFYWNVNNVYD